MAPRNQVLHRNSADMDRRDPTHVAGMAHRLYEARSPRGHHSTWGHGYTVSRKPVGNDDLEKIKDNRCKQWQTSSNARADSSGDMVCLAVAMPQSPPRHTSRRPQTSGRRWLWSTTFEYVDFEAKGKNQFGEADGRPEELRQALEAAEWEGDAALDFNEDGDGFEGTFAAEEAEMNMELFGMKGALHGFRP